MVIMSRESLRNKTKINIKNKATISSNKNQHQATKQWRKRQNDTAKKLMLFVSHNVIRERKEEKRKSQQESNARLLVNLRYKRKQKKQRQLMRQINCGNDNDPNGPSNAITMFNSSWLLRHVLNGVLRVIKKILGAATEKSRANSNLQLLLTVVLATFASIKCQGMGMRIRVGDWNSKLRLTSRECIKYYDPNYSLSTVMVCSDHNENNDSYNAYLFFSQNIGFYEFFKLPTTSTPNIIIPPDWSKKTIDGLISKLKVISEEPAQLLAKLCSREKQWINNGLKAVLNVDHEIARIINHHTRTLDEQESHQLPNEQNNGLEKASKILELYFATPPNFGGHNFDNTRTYLKESVNTVGSVEQSLEEGIKKLYAEFTLNLFYMAEMRPPNQEILKSIIRVLVGMRADSIGFIEALKAYDIIQRTLKKINLEKQEIILPILNTAQKRFMANKQNLFLCTSSAAPVQELQVFFHYLTVPHGEVFEDHEGLLCKRPLQRSLENVQKMMDKMGNTFVGVGENNSINPASSVVALFVFSIIIYLIRYCVLHYSPKQGRYKDALFMQKITEKKNKKQIEEEQEKIKQECNEVLLKINEKKKTLKEMLQNAQFKESFYKKGYADYLKTHGDNISDDNKKNKNENLQQKKSQSKLDKLEEMFLKHFQQLKNQIIEKHGTPEEINEKISAIENPIKEIYALLNKSFNAQDKNELQQYLLELNNIVNNGSKDYESKRDEKNEGNNGDNTPISDMLDTLKSNAEIVVNMEKNYKTIINNYKKIKEVTQKIQDINVVLQEKINDIQRVQQLHTFKMYKKYFLSGALQNQFQSQTTVQDLTQTTENNLRQIKEWLKQFLEKDFSIDNLSSKDFSNDNGVGTIYFLQNKFSEFTKKVNKNGSHIDTIRNSLSQAELYLLAPAAEQSTSIPGVTIQENGSNSLNIVPTTKTEIGDEIKNNDNNQNDKNKKFHKSNGELPQKIIQEKVLQTNNIFNQKQMNNGEKKSPEQSRKIKQKEYHEWKDRHTQLCNNLNAQISKHGSFIQDAENTREERIQSLASVLKINDIIAYDKLQKTLQEFSQKMLTGNIDKNIKFFIFPFYIQSKSIETQSNLSTTLSTAPTENSAVSFVVIDMEKSPVIKINIYDNNVASHTESDISNISIEESIKESPIVSHIKSCFLGETNKSTASFTTSVLTSKIEIFFYTAEEIKYQFFPSIDFIPKNSLKELDCFVMSQFLINFKYDSVFSDAVKSADKLSAKLSRQIMKVDNLKRSFVKMVGLINVISSEKDSFNILALHLYLRAMEVKEEQSKNSVDVITSNITSNNSGNNEEPSWENISHRIKKQIEKYNTKKNNILDILDEFKSTQLSQLEIIKPTNKILKKNTSSLSHFDFLKPYVQNIQDINKKNFNDKKENKKKQEQEYGGREFYALIAVTIRALNFLKNTSTSTNLVNISNLHHDLANDMRNIMLHKKRFFKRSKRNEITGKLRAFVTALYQATSKETYEKAINNLYLYISDYDKTINNTTNKTINNTTTSTLIYSQGKTIKKFFMKEEPKKPQKLRKFGGISEEISEEISNEISEVLDIFKQYESKGENKAVFSQQETDILCGAILSFNACINYNFSMQEALQVISISEAGLEVSADFFDKNKVCVLQFSFGTIFYSATNTKLSIGSYLPDDKKMKNCSNKLQNMMNKISEEYKKQGKNGNNDINKNVNMNCKVSNNCVKINFISSLGTKEYYPDGYSDTVSRTLKSQGGLLRLTFAERIALTDFLLEVGGEVSNRITRNLIAHFFEPRSSIKYFSEINTANLALFFRCLLQGFCERIPQLQPQLQYQLPYQVQSSFGL